MVLECHGIKPPPVDGGIPSNVIDLDNPAIRSVLNGDNQNEPQRADCFIVYAHMTAVMEIKTSYPEKAIPQLRKTAELLSNKWNEFLNVAGLSTDTPRPSAYYFIVENGIGHSRYEVDDNNNLRERSNNGKNKGPIQYAEDHIPIKVYSKRDIQNSYNLWR